MELGHGGRTALDDWAMAARALDLGFAADLVGVPRPDADGRLWRLVERLSEAGGWSTHTDGQGPSRIARTGRREAASVAIWTSIADIDAAVADLLAAMDSERTRRPPDWRIGGLVIARSCGPNRRRVSEAEDLMYATFPTSGTHWMTALSRPDAPMPATPAYCWASGDEASRLDSGQASSDRGAEAESENLGCGTIRDVQADVRDPPEPLARPAVRWPMPSTTPRRSLLPLIFLKIIDEFGVGVEAVAFLAAIGSLPGSGRSS